MSLVASPKIEHTPPNPPRNLFSEIMRIFLTILRWFVNEWRHFIKAFSTPTPFVLLLVSFLGLTLAWQIGFNYKLDPHQDTLLDEPFYHGFNKVEFSKTNGKYDLTSDGKLKPYRWTTGDAYWLFPAVGKTNYHFKLTVAGSANPHPDFVVLANSVRIGTTHAEAGISTYEYAIPDSLISNDDDLKIELQTKTFTPPGDARQLGLAFFSGEITADGGSLTLPPISQLSLLFTVVLFVYLIFFRAGFGSLASFGGASVILVALFFGIASGARPWITIFNSALVFSVVLTYFFLVVADLIMHRLWADNLSKRWVLAIFSGAFAIRLAGLLHPQINVVDIGFHIHQLDALWNQGILFNKIQSAEFGGRYTIYPPTPYLFIGLFRWFIPDEKLLLEIFMVALESSRILLIYILAQKALKDSRTAILSAFFLATMPVGALSVAWGQVSNLFGEWLLLATLTLVVVKFDQLRKPVYFFLTILLLTLAFISHPGVILLAGTAFLLLGVFITFRKGNRTFALIYLLALVLSFSLYHVQVVGDMIPQALDTVQSKFSSSNKNLDKLPDYQVGGSVGDERLSKEYGLTQKVVHNRTDWLIGGLEGFWAEARTYFNVLPLAVIPWFLWWLWHNSANFKTISGEDKQKQMLRRLFWAVVAWFTTAGLFAIIGLTINLYVRYSLFLLPIAALGIAAFLAKLWERTGWPGRVVTFAVSIYFLVTVVALYYDRVIYANH